MGKIGIATVSPSPPLFPLHCGDARSASSGVVRIFSTSEGIGVLDLVFLISFRFLSFAVDFHKGRTAHVLILTSTGFEYD